ncbi:MAG: hypothetical protein KC466_02865 [Myxococcales bacterium]|nr:hypothetical protein [Myxococcales bacterium]
MAALAAVAALAPGRAGAVDLVEDRLQLFGFAKSLTSYAHPTDARGRWETLTRLRPGLRWNALRAEGIEVDVEAVYEIRARAFEGGGGATGDEVGGAGGFLALGALPRVVDLDKRIADGDHLEVVHEVDRLILGVHHDRFRLLVGRQGVTWGIGSIWSPEDRFVPFNPTEIDQYEKRGIDAVRATLYPSDLSQLDLVWVPAPRGRSSDHARAGGRLTVNVRGYDVTAMGAYFDRDWVLGGDLRGNLGDAAVRLEATYTLADPRVGREARVPVRDAINAARLDPSTGMLLPGETLARAPARGDFVEVVAGVDYSVGDLTMTFEYYFNGEGFRHPEDFVFGLPRLAQGEAQQLGRHYAAAVFSYQATPLLTLNHTAIAAIGAPASAFTATSLAYNLLANLDVEVGVDLTLGARSPLGGRFAALGPTGALDLRLTRVTKGEFQNYPDIVYAKIQYFF